MLLASSASAYSRLFRPWDADKEMCSDLNNSDKTKDQSKTVERENKLRKVRGQYKPKSAIQQDSTISTTTEELPNYEAISERLTKKPEAAFNQSEINSKEESTHLYSYQQYDGYMHHQRYPDYLSQAELAQTLGIPPTDPLLLESFAQGYAMELEYARIMHQENQNKLLNSRKQRPKKYRCPHCDVGFSNNGQLKGHIRIHTGERPFKCDDKNCGKTFTRNEELTRHRRIHSGLRPYPCATCGKKFGRRDHLKKHTRTHIVQAERMMPMFVPLTAMGYPYVYGY